MTAQHIIPERLAQYQEAFARLENALPEVIFRRDCRDCIANEGIGRLLYLIHDLEGAAAVLNSPLIDLNDDQEDLPSDYFCSSAAYKRHWGM